MFGLFRKPEELDERIDVMTRLNNERVAFGMYREMIEMSLKAAACNREREESGPMYACVDHVCTYGWVRFVHAAVRIANETGLQIVSATHAGSEGTVLFLVPEEFVRDQQDIRNQ